MKTSTKNAPIGFIDAIKNYWLGYIDFNGTSSRREYWYAWFFCIILSLLVNTLFGGIIGTILFAIMFLPSRALAFRRFRDVGISGWCYLIPFVTLGAWGFIRSETWTFVSAMGQIPVDFPVFFLLYSAALLGFLIILVQPSKEPAKKPKK